MENKTYLPYLFHEDLYPIPEESAGPSTDTNTQPSQETSSTSPVPLMVITPRPPESEATLLTKILGAIGLDPDQVPVYAPGEATASTADKVLVFDDKLPDGATYYTPSQTHHGSTLTSRSLRVLSQSPDDKKALWTALKSWMELG